MTDRRNIVDRLIQNRFLTHLLFWTGYLMIFTLLATLNFGFSKSQIKEHFISYFTLLPIQIVAGYLLVYYQVPRILLRHKYLQFAISFLLSIYVFSVLARLSTIYIAEPFFRSVMTQESLTEVLSDPMPLATIYFPAVYVVVFLMLALKVVKDRFEERHQIEVLQKEKANTELKFLKAQIHPHFLFNTLNSLYALTLSKSDQAPDLILKLSDMLDYLLYQCNVPTVQVEKERNLIQDYIDLETLRYGNGFDVIFNYENDEPSIQIAPLILLSFVENAFKHGLSQEENNPSMNIDLRIRNKQLHFNLKNSKPITHKNENVERVGIGLSNVERQLELNYKGRYKLEIVETENTYVIDLKINFRGNEN